MTGTFFPQPIFEGAEKRLELDFELACRSVEEVMVVESADSDSEASCGLRTLKEAEWNKLLQPAECCIVSSKSNGYCDAYLLSESSLFVYESRVVLKTCGRTKILDAVPGIVSAALENQQIGLKLRRAKYSRSAFKCPEQQPEPHTNFSLEVEALNGLFGHLKGGGHAYVLGDQVSNALWHVYTAGQVQEMIMESRIAKEDLMTLEICMTGLDSKYCEQFTCDANSNLKGTKKKLRTESGIEKMLGSQEAIDDYVFDPCGYSLNSVKGETLVTIHITPEDSFSYASIEVCGIKRSEDFDSNAFVQLVADLFKPQSLYVVATCDGFASALEWCDCKLGHSEPGAGSGQMFEKLFSANQVMTRYGNCAFHAFASDGVREEFGSGNMAAKLDKPPFSPITVLREDGMSFSDSSSSGSSEEAQRDETLLPLSESDMDTNFVKRVRADTIETSNCVERYAGCKIRELGLEDTFYVFDLGNVYRRMKTWQRLLPRVKPFYAVKCNPDPGVLSTLASLGTGFDCASQMELESVLSLGVSPDSVVYANACKRPSDLRHMRQTGTLLTTFDSESELLKIKQYHPSAQVVLRIRADDPNARCYLGNKYGAETYEVEHLLRKTIELGLNLVGVSFHVGSGASDPEAFRMAIGLARQVFNAALALGITTMDLLDIGGGFSGGTGDGTEALGKVARVIRASLDKHFGEEGRYRIIAEPGRYFSEGACSLFTCVYGKRRREEKMEYWLTDGLYGSMNCVIYDHAKLAPKPFFLKSSAPVEDLDLYSSTLFGPTCDGLDTVLKDVMMPRLDNGDWIIFPAMGAYTISAASNFNGISACDPQIFYVVSKTE